ncbi:Rv0361 family membrane protein [Corynebacterium xerosis]|uniref:DUF4878 domain-containing protein n=1 Tax=Corynebacterium xerosis TaxID=1725 RepID=A0ABV3UY79_9CORY
MSDPGNGFGQQPGNGGPAGGGNGNQWGNPGGQGFGGGNAAGGGNPYGFGPGSGGAQPQGPGAGGYGGPAPDPNHGSKPKNKTGVILAIVAVLAVFAVVAGAAWWFLVGSENREKSEVYDAANAAAERIQSSSDLTVWNALMCAEYRGTDKDIEFAQNLLGSMADDSLDMSDQEFTPQDADDVTFSNDEKTRASVGTGTDEVLMAKEDGEWKICDPELDFTIFEGGAELGDSLDPDNW